MFSSPPVPAVSRCFIHGHSHLLCHWATAFGLTRAAKRLCPSAGSPLPSCPPVSRDPRVFRLGTTADIRTDPFQYNITSIDRHTGCRIWQVVFKTCGNLCFILHIGSRGCQRHGWTLNPNVLTCFKQEVCLLRWWWQRHAPKSRLLNFRGTLKTGTWDDKSRENLMPAMPIEVERNLKFQILIHQNKCHIELQLFVVIAGEKLFSKRVWHRLRPPAVYCSWRPLRPSRPAAACRSPRCRRVLQDAAEWNLSTAGVGGTTCCGSPRLLSSQAVAVVPDVHGRALRQEKGDDRRVVVGMLPRAARPGGTSVPSTSKSRPRQRRSRRRWPRTAAQVAVLRRHGRCCQSRRGEKCSRNEVPQFLWSLCFIFSKYKSATYGDYIE